MESIEVSNLYWNKVSKETQDAITNILRTHGLIGKSDIIVGADIPIPYEENDVIMELRWNPARDICKATCDTAAVAAFAACNIYTSGVAFAACTLAAATARDKCRDNC